MQWVLTQGLLVPWHYNTQHRVVAPDGAFNGYFRGDGPKQPFCSPPTQRWGMNDVFYLSSSCRTALLTAHNMVSFSRQKTSLLPFQRAARCCFPGSLHESELFVNTAMCANQSPRSCAGTGQQGCAPVLLISVLQHFPAVLCCFKRALAGSAVLCSQGNATRLLAPVPAGELPRSALLLLGSVALASSTVHLMVIDGANLLNEEYFIRPFVGNLLLQQADDPALPFQHLDVEVDGS